MKHLFMDPRFPDLVEEWAGEALVTDEFHSHTLSSQNVKRLIPSHEPSGAAASGPPVARPLSTHCGR